MKSRPFRAELGFLGGGVPGAVPRAIAGRPVGAKVVRTIVMRPRCGGMHPNAARRNGGASRRHSPCGSVRSPTHPPMLAPLHPQGGCARNLIPVVSAAAHSYPARKRWPTIQQQTSF